MEYKYDYINKKIKYKFKFFHKLKLWNNNPKLAILYFENLYKDKLKLRLKICFQEINYNIKYKKITFWLNLNKKWEIGRPELSCQLGNGKLKMQN